MDLLGMHDTDGPFQGLLDLHWFPVVFSKGISMLIRSEFKRFPGNNPFFLWKGLLLETIQTKVLWTSRKG